MQSEDFAGRWRSGRMYPAFRARAKLYRFALQLKAASSAVEVRHLSGSGWSLRDFCGESVGEIHRVTVVLGTPGPTQSVTAQLVEKKGEVLGYLRFAVTPVSRRKLKREYRLLEKIPESTGPTPIKLDNFGRGIALIKSSVPGRPLSGALPPTEDLAGYLRPLITRSPVASDEHPWFERIAHVRSPLLQKNLDVLSGRKWEVSIQHGDFAPWNVLQDADGTLRAIDWELGTVKGMPYLDLAYYMLQTSCLIHRRSPQRALRESARYLLDSAAGLSSDEAISLTRMAAADSYHRAVKNGVGTGTSLQRWRKAVIEAEA